MDRSRMPNGTSTFLSIIIFVATTTMDLTNPDTYSRLLTIGQDLSILIGVWSWFARRIFLIRWKEWEEQLIDLIDTFYIVWQVYMVTTKIFYFYFNQRDIASMLKILVNRYLALSNSDDPKIRQMQRFYYFQETILFLLNYFNGVMLALSFPIQVNVYCLYVNFETKCNT